MFSTEALASITSDGCSREDPIESRAEKTISVKRDGSGKEAEKRAAKGNREEQQRGAADGAE